MRALGLQAIQAKKFKVTTDSNHSKAVTPDLLEQDFSAAAANKKLTSDIGYVWTDEGWLYLVVVMDLTSHCGVVDEPTDDATTGVYRPDYGLVPPQLSQSHFHPL